MSTIAAPDGRDHATLRATLRRLEPPRVTLETSVALDAEIVELLRERLSAIAEREIAVETRVNPRLAAGTSIRLGAEATIDLEPDRRFLAQLDARLGALDAAASGDVARAAGVVARALAERPAATHMEAITDRGRVLQVGDGVAVVDGLRDVRSQEVVRFEGGVSGIALDLLERTVGCLLLGDEAGIDEGSTVVRTGELLHVPVGEGLIGRTVDALGRPLDGAGEIVATRRAPIESVSPGVVQRAPVAESLHTGIKVIDALVPLGRGQRELVLGDRKIGKTTLALDVVLSQKGTGVVCVYAAIGQRAASVAQLTALLEERGAMEYTTIVAALASDPPGYRYVAPYTACAIAEELMYRGRHALVIYDDLSKHAVTYREISSLLQRPIGREAYPGDVFHVHSRLLERATRLRDDLGGGSLTAIPIVETLAGDISGLIPTNVISICDGQIFLDAALFNGGTRPAMDVGLSVSRVGGMAQTPAMRKVASRLRIDLAQYREMARFVKFGAEVDAATLEQLERGERELEVLKQDAHTPLPAEHEVVILFAAVNGYLDDLPLERVREFEAELVRFLELRHPEELAAIRDTHDLTAAAEARLGALVTELKTRFLAGPAGGAAP